MSDWNNESVRGLIGGPGTRNRHLVIGLWSAGRRSSRLVLQIAQLEPVYRNVMLRARADAAVPRSRSRRV